MILEVFRIGAAAAEVMQNAKEGSVIGVTSRGAFLRAGDRIIYLTSANYRSPFNLTLAGGDQRFERLEPGDRFFIVDGSLQFPAHRMSVRTETAEYWEPHLPVPIRRANGDQKLRSMEIADQLCSLDKDKGFLFLSRPTGIELSPDQVRILDAAYSIVKGFQQQDKTQFLNAAATLIGTGGGLTPSGDDFLTGFLLYHVRRELASGEPSSFLADWCKELTTLAFNKTTTISANRLLFAARGWSEDIFLHLIDHLFDPAVTFTCDEIRLLMEIGHSSGVDTFMGIYYAIIAIN